MPATRYVYHFRPPTHLTKLGHRTLEKMERSAGNIDLRSNVPLPGSQLHLLHHDLRRQLPLGAKAADVSKKLEEVSQARALLDMGVPGLRFLPARVDATNILIPSLFNTAKEPGVVEFDLSELVGNRRDLLPENMRLKMPVQVTALGPRQYAIEWYGMQGSYVPPGTPANVRRWYDNHAPQLGLALMAKALKQSGAQKVLVPGEDFAIARKGHKRSDFLRWLQYQRKSRTLEIEPEVASLVERHFHALTNEQIYSLIERDPRLSKFGFPPRLIRRYYRDIPSTFRSTPTRLWYPSYPFGEHEFYDLDLRQFEPMRLYFTAEEQKPPE